MAPTGWLDEQARLGELLGRHASKLEHVMEGDCNNLSFGRGNKGPASRTFLQAQHPGHFQHA